MRATAPSSGLAAVARRLRRGELDPLEYLDALERRFDEIEPDLRCFVPEEGRFERLREEARALVEAHGRRRERPPLFGIPVGVKDIFHAAGFATRAGSRLPAEALAGPEADAVTRLKRAGALIMGKTVSTEFAYFAPGPTRNPHRLEHTPGGSSSGSAAAVAARLCPLALGTQTIGSISRPASYCGVVGFKPSYDRISRAGVIPLSEAVDHVGLFAPEAAGAREAAACLVEEWRPVTPAKPPVLGLPEGPYLERSTPEAREILAQAAARLRSSGFEVRRVRALEDLEQIERRHQLLVAAGAAEAHAAWFEEFRELYDPRTATLVRQGREVAPAEHEAALDGRRELRSSLHRLMDEEGIDLWLSPGATGPAPRGLEGTGDPIMSLPWTHAGVPTLTLPAAVSASGLPVGVQLAGRWHRDEELLGWSLELERSLSP